MELIIDQLTRFFEGFFDSSVLPNSVKWITIAAILLFVELGHRAWLIIWFSLGALSAALVAQFLPGDLFIQFSVFFVVSAGSMAGFVYYRHQDEKAQPPTSIIPNGRKVRCTQEINGSQSGIVSLDGVAYKARLEEPGLQIKPDQWVQVSGFDTDELTVIVKPLEESAPHAGS